MHDENTLFTILYLLGVSILPLCNFSIGFCNCYDNVIMFVFHLFIQIIQTLDLTGRR